MEMLVIFRYQNAIIRYNKRDHKALISQGFSVVVFANLEYAERFAESLGIGYRIA